MKNRIELIGTIIFYIILIVFLLYMTTICLTASSTIVNILGVISGGATVLFTWEGISTIYKYIK